MAGLLYSRELPSGKRSRYFIVETNEGISNYWKEGFIPYSEVRELLQKNDAFVVKDGLAKRLGIDGEELDLLTIQILDENANGRWDKPLAVEKK